VKLPKVLRRNKYTFSLKEASSSYAEVYELTLFLNGEEVRSKRIYSLDYLKSKKRGMIREYENLISHEKRKQKLLKNLGLESIEK
jgi:hypothetical protein